MNTITIPDLHGRNNWKEIDPDKYDKIIFIGDYLDSYHLPNDDITNNLLDIIEFKKKYSKKVILLLGNHELQYYFVSSKYGCSGYRYSMYHVIHSILQKEKKLFKAAHSEVTEEFTYLWTHAGVHEDWYYNHFYPTIKEDEVLLESTLAEQFNNQFLVENPTLFQVGYLRGGYSSVGGIFWADKLKTQDKPMHLIRQIVGHTPVPEITTVDFDYFTSITYVDNIEKSKELYNLII